MPLPCHRAYPPSENHTSGRTTSKGADHFEVDPGNGSIENKIQALGSVTGRVGVAFNNALLYAKGGYAWADNKVTLISIGTVSDSQFHSGWTIGGGVEYGFAPNWSVKGEYMYVDFQSKTFFNAFELGTTLHTVKGGINYRFGAF